MFSEIYFTLIYNVIERKIDEDEESKTDYNDVLCMYIGNGESNGNVGTLLK